MEVAVKGMVGRFCDPLNKSRLSYGVGEYTSKRRGMLGNRGAGTPGERGKVEVTRNEYAGMMEVGDVVDGSFNI